MFYVVTHTHLLGDPADNDKEGVAPTRLDYFVQTHKKKDFFASVCTVRHSVPIYTQEWRGDEFTVYIGLPYLENAAHPCKCMARAIKV